MVSGSVRNWLQLMQFNNPVSTKYDNSTLEKIHGPVAFAACFPSHPARVRLLCAFAGSASGQSRRRMETIPEGNTAEGRAALLSLTTGSFNTGVGFLSLRSNATGQLNTAIGAGTASRQHRGRKYGH